MAFLIGVYADELDEVYPEFVAAVSKLAQAGNRYEAILCGMATVLAQLAADVPPDTPADADNEYLQQSTAAIMQTVKDIVRAREPNPAS